MTRKITVLTLSAMLFALCGLLPERLQEDVLPEASAGLGAPE
jgi:hypothetical protein